MADYLPKFGRTGSDGFYNELKKRVDQYFKENQKSELGDFRIYYKAVLLALAVMGLYAHLVWFDVSGVVKFVECFFLGIAIAGIGFNVMHDGAHGSFSSVGWINNLASFSLNIFGGSHFFWKQKHNVIHHTFTNIAGVDDDIEIEPWLRLSQNQNRIWIHRFQHFYFWFLYAQFFLFWIFYLDYRKYFTRKIGQIDTFRMKVRDHFVFWASKLFHAAFFIVIPIYKVGFLPWLIGFTVVLWTTGFVLSLVFQLAHTVTQTSFPSPDQETLKMPSNWAVHQLSTTCNFAVDKKWVSWYLGGLNFQVEHHLFPKVSHVHYPALNRILRETCREYGAPYLENKTLWSAVFSHVLFLRRLGTHV